MMYDLEKTLILAFYKFDKTHNMDRFAKHYRTYFKKDISLQTLRYEYAKCRNIDPATNMKQDESSKEYVELWTYYISQGREELLKDMYRCFKKGEVIEMNHEEFDLTSDDRKDRPVEKPQILTVNETKVQRDPLVLARALEAAEFKCELACSNTLFVRKSNKEFYTEGHHLIPLKYQKDFAYSLDVEANIVSLCPTCHRELHYGEDGKEKVKELYAKRIERLKTCKISVSLEQLLAMYEDES